MASLRPAKCYRWDSPAYTRVSNNPSDSYITGIPGSKIIHYDMGNPTGDFNTKVEIVYNDKCQVRHNALEATRILVQKRLEKLVGVTNYHFKVNVFPHHVMRENVQASGAGADRVSEGMRRSYGKPIGRAARLKPGQALFTVRFNKTDTRLKTIKKALRLASNKLPGDKSVIVSELKK
ncbi:MAG: 50S ribosomal protein L16 [Candidatus Altiarchaeales archaeon]|nr:50S ribosomal protein L16 [Candidatus Altiarchaeales archaeon]MBD3415506.1 50S ribosomal protein L16 [Candidatus Altiarchaeales archaeon]